MCKKRYHPGGIISKLRKADILYSFNVYILLATILKLVLQIWPNMYSGYVEVPIEAVKEHMREKGIETRSTRILTVSVHFEKGPSR